MNSVDKTKFSCLCTCHVIYGYCLLVKECIHLGSNVHPKVEQPRRRYPIEVKVSLLGFSILNIIIVKVIKLLLKLLSTQEVPC